VPENFHALYDRGFRTSRGLTPSPAAPTISASARKLSREVKDLQVYYDQATQLPNMITVKSAAKPLARTRGVRGLTTADD
jgi:hypothetical protein